jgi:hypothetical protein
MAAGTGTFLASCTRYVRSLQAEAGQHGGGPGGPGQARPDNFEAAFRRPRAGPRGGDETLFAPSDGARERADLLQEKYEMCPGKTTALILEAPPGSPPPTPSETLALADRAILEADLAGNMTVWVHGDEGSAILADTRLRANGARTVVMRDEMARAAGAGPGASAARGGGGGERAALEVAVALVASRCASRVCAGAAAGQSDLALWADVLAVATAGSSDYRTNLGTP